jgi:Transposase domain (DUF772)
MFKKNKLHLQPILICSVNELPEEQREHLNNSWSGVFYREFFCRLDEEPFAVLYANVPSRPNVPVNVLVGLEYLKAGFGWSDEEMYEAFLYNLQVRYALGYDEFGAGYFDLRTLYYFRERLSHYMQENGVNLLDQAFEQVTDEQLAAFQVKTNLQRMDSTMVASNIRQVGRLQLLVVVLQRVQRMLSQADQGQYAEAFAPYLKGHAGHYVYRLKREEYAEHIQKIGEFMCRLLSELKAGYGNDPIYQVLERVFNDHFRIEGTTTKAKAHSELSASSLQSPDDLEATFRQKRTTGYLGYVANLTETCHPENKLQLITKVQVASNHTNDPCLLVEALPNLKRRTNLDTLYTDGGHTGPGPDAILNELHVTQIQTGIRGRHPNPEKLSLSDFSIQFDQDGQPVHVTCPMKQQVPMVPGRQKGGWVGLFDPAICHACSFQIAGKCPTRFCRTAQRPEIYFHAPRLHPTQRRRQTLARSHETRNPRAAIEATVRSVKHPFPASQLPVRGRFRMACLLIGSAAMTNVRRIQHHLIAQSQPVQQADSFLAFVKAAWLCLVSQFQPSDLYMGC